jgi:hypothetical protein
MSWEKPPIQKGGIVWLLSDRKALVDEEQP